MDSYEIPNVDGMSSEQAGQEINRITAEGAEHPYFSGNHIQHSDFVSVMGKLNEIKYADADELTPLERGMQDGLDAKVTRQNDLTIEAQEEMDALVEMGFDRSDIPNDIKPFQRDALKMQRLHAQGNFDELSPLLETQLEGLNVPPAERAAFDIFRQSDTMDTDLKSEILEKLILWVHSANEIKHGGE